MEQEYVEVPSHSLDMGAPYSQSILDQRRSTMSTTSEDANVKIIDSHMHLDKLQMVSKMHDLNSILEEVPMPATPISLTAAIVSFCHGHIDPVEKALIEEDARLYFTYGIHPKMATYIANSYYREVTKSVNQDPRCVGYGEVGLDYSGRYQETSAVQREVFSRILCKYQKSVEKDSKLVLVIHCRDKVGQTKASTDCLQCLKRYLSKEIRPKVKLHRHCFNGSWAEVEAWQSEFPLMKFGFTALLLRGGCHPELDQVVKRLPLDSLMLESDSPYLQTPVHREHRFNTAYGIEEVAWRIATLRDTTTEAVLKATAKTAALFFSLRTPL